jgi:hypothetical protein
MTGRVPDFDELVGDDLDAEERTRLLRAHELLLAAGPPPELPPSLAQPPDPEPKVAYLPVRRRFTVLGIAAALALAAFGAGYFTGGARNNGFSTAAVAAMHGTRLAPNARATIRIAEPDAAGNWPMRFSVTGLAQLRPGQYYELYLTKDGKPTASCGTFTVHAGTTDVRLNAPYELRKFSGWVVTRHDQSRRGDGPVLLTT